MSERPCIIHIGTHKTGTTSLQIFVQQNFEAFFAAGLHAAQAGRIVVTDDAGTITGASPGNHELAWDLVGDRRAELDEFLAELSESPCRSAFVSSEDFSLLYARAPMLELMNREIRTVGFVPKIAVWLRAQGPYAESMYVERIKQGHFRPIREYLDEIVRDGRYLPAGTAQDIAFSYTRLLEPFELAFGLENVAVRAYAPTDYTEIFREFLSLVANLDPGIVEHSPKVRVYRPRENESLTFGELLVTLHDGLRPGVPLPQDPAEFLARYAPELPPDLANARFSLLSRDEHLQLLERFASENAAVAERFGAAVPFQTDADVRPVDDPMWETSRIERQVFDRCLTEWSTGSTPASQMR